MRVERIESSDDRPPLIPVAATTAPDVLASLKAFP
jgi:hypothetical protein